VELTLADCQKYFKKSMLKHKEARVVTFANNKGGVGKTVHAYTFATTACLFGYKVLLIDLDAQMNLSDIFIEDYEGELPSIMDLYDGKNLRNIAIPIEPGLNFVKSNEEIDVLKELFATSAPEKTLNPLNFIRRSLGVVKDEEFILKNKIDEVREDFDLIIIDTNPSIDKVNRSAYFATDHMVIPINPHGFSLSGLPKILPEFISARGKAGYPYKMGDVSILINNPMGSKSFDKFMNEIAEMKELLIPEVINFMPSLNESFNECLPIWSNENTQRWELEAVIRLTKSILDKVFGRTERGIEVEL